MEAFRQELHGAKKQTTRREDGLATIFFVIKTSWSVEFVHFIHYLVFLFLLTQVVLGPPRINRWFMHRSYQDHFISNEDPANAIVSFEKINTKAQFFDWMESTFVPNMFPGYVDEQATNYTHNNIYETKLANGMGYRLGAVRLVQLRVEDDGCQVSKLFERAVTRCNPKFTDPVEQVTESHLGESWQSEAMLGTGEAERGAKGQANNAISSDENHTRSYFLTSRTPSPTNAVVLTHYPTPLCDSLRSSQATSTRT